MNYKLWTIFGICLIPAGGAGFIFLILLWIHKKLDEIPDQNDTPEEKSVEKIKPKFSKELNDATYKKLQETWR